jgi:SnoaL-like polyketide cyclase
MKKLWSPVLLSAFVVSLLCAFCNNSQAPSSTETKTSNDSSSNNDQLTQERLRRFDSLDFQFYSNQRWDSFAISHDPNIKVYYPDGTTTTGLFPQHINMLTPLFAFAPDTKIIEHPVKFGSGDWTTVVGTLEGTFSKPMDLGNGKSIPPTNKKFRLSMCTVGRWKDGKMTEEHLFWDNQAMMKQIGLGQ